MPIRSCRLSQHQQSQWGLLAGRLGFALLAFLLFHSSDTQVILHPPCRQGAHNWEHSGEIFMRNSPGFLSRKKCSLNPVKGRGQFSLCFIVVSLHRVFIVFICLLLSFSWNHAHYECTGEASYDKFKINISVLSYNNICWFYSVLTLAVIC